MSLFERNVLSVRLYERVTCMGTWETSTELVQLVATISLAPVLYYVSI